MTCTWKRNSRRLTGLAAAVLLTIATSEAATAGITAASIEARTRTISSDAFEGRAPATPGEEKTIAYLEAEFRKLGLQPGNPDGTYLQSVPLVGITSDVKATFRAGNQTIAVEPVTEFTALSRRLTPTVDVPATDLVFVGYGVVAPEYGWDDYKGLDVRGKIIVMLVGDPPVPDPTTGRLDERMFKGKAMTYYGRWMYKYEIAAAKGAAGCLIVHETGPAGYPFAVLGSAWGRESFDLVRADRNAGLAAIEGWLTLDAATKLFTAAGQDYAKLKAAAAKKEFRPVPLAATAAFSARNSVRNVTSHNVVAALPGADAQAKDEWIVYSAHWDHLGRDPRLSGDQIFNGASDNAIGVAMLLEIAETFAARPPAERPKRSLLFLALTAEEKGLLGARYYAENPLHPLPHTVANLNFDRGQTVGPTRDLEVVGYGNSDLDDLATAILARSGRVPVPDTESEKGRFYRSDHFEFAKLGVPAFYTHPGKDVIGQPAGTGKNREDEYTSIDYHKVTDEIKPWWNFAGAVADAGLFFEMGRQLANGRDWPQWKPGNEFKAKRDESAAARGGP
jgi:Zn-dependent M28 family amino/carboxypeptidase